MNSNLKISSEKYLITPLLLLLSFFFSYFFAYEVSELVRSGLYFCFTTIIGSVFPFMILTDALFAFSNFENMPFLGRAFEKLFNISGYGVRAFFAGIICGFPLGVKAACDLYQSGAISKEECERLIGFANNTGPAFIVFAIGAVMRKSLFDGAVLYLSMIFSAIIVGILMGLGKGHTREKKKFCKVEYSLVDSVKSAGLNTLYICSFITFFSVLLGLLKKILPSSIYLYAVPFLEVGNASKILSESHINPVKSLLLTSFAISFSGISVFLQAKSFLPKEISVKKYTLAKIMQGCISALIAYIFTLFY